MKKSILLLIITIVGFTLVGCSNRNIIPEGYIEQKIYSDASIEQLGHTIQYNVYKYDSLPNLSKNRFLEKVTEDHLITLVNILYEYEAKLDEYDQEAESHEFKENYEVNIENISTDDYIYIDSSPDYVIIYYFETSNNTLYYLQQIFKEVK